MSFAVWWRFDSNSPTENPWIAVVQGTLGNDWRWCRLDGAPWSAVLPALTALMTWIAA